MNMRKEFELIAEGFIRLPRYERFGGRGGDTHPVPGVGPIIWCSNVDGRTFACRSDGYDHVIYMSTQDGWKKIDPR